MRRRWSAVRFKTEPSSPSTNAAFSGGVSLRMYGADDGQVKSLSGFVQ